MSDRGDITELETMVDKHNISGLLEMLSIICAEKAEHLASNWQDENAARVWRKRSNIVDECAGRVSRTE